MKQHSYNGVLATALAIGFVATAGAATLNMPTKTGSQPANAAPQSTGTQSASKVTLPGVTGPRPTGSAPGPLNVGPTDNITKVANAIQVRAKSLTTLVTFAPGLALTQPVTISIGYYTPWGNTARDNLFRQNYVASTGNHFLFNDYEGDGKPRNLHMPIVLTEPNPKGGIYSYAMDVNLRLDPLYDVTVNPLKFTLLQDCADIGHTQIMFKWLPPNLQGIQADKELDFYSGAGKSNDIWEFSWARAEVSGSAGLHVPVVGFDSTGWTWSGFGTTTVGSWGVDSAKTPNLVPGQTRTIKGKLTAVSNGSCFADFEYTITYTLRWYPYL